MIKEAVLRVYNFIVSRFFLFMRLIPLKNSIVLLTSYGDNINYIIQNPKLRYYDEVIIYTERTYNFKHYNNVTVYSHSNFNLKELYEISRAKNIILDNYFPVLGGMNTLKPYVTVIQTWHAVGAVKAFGLADQTFNYRPKRSKDRFQRTYQNVDYYISGSKTMSEIFKKAFNINDDKILKTSMPRLDFYNDEAVIKHTNDCLRKSLNISNEAIIITYAPTYRENQFNVNDIHLDIEKMTRVLPNNYIIALRLHPTVELNIDLKNVINLSKGYSLESVLSMTDILITDYSSVGCEFSNLERPIIYYPYDIDDYKKEKGLIDKYENLTTSNIAYSTDDIIQMIKENQFSIDEIRKFKHQWNEYNHTNNTNVLVKVLK